MYIYCAREEGKQIDTEQIHIDILINTSLPHIYLLANQAERSSFITNYMMTKANPSGLSHKSWSEYERSMSTLTKDTFQCKLTATKLAHSRNYIPHWSRVSHSEAVHSDMCIFGFGSWAWICPHKYNVHEVHEKQKTRSKVINIFFKRCTGCRRALSCDLPIYERGRR